MKAFISMPWTKPAHPSTKNKISLAQTIRNERNWSSSPLRPRRKCDLLPPPPLPPSALPRPSISNHNKYQTLHQFFTATENIDLQFADRAEVHPIDHPSQDLLDTFHRLNAQRRLEAGLTPLAASTPQTTRIVGLTNPPMHCLGLTLHSVTHVGIQTFVNDDGQYPEVHLTLMETEFEATGPQFLVHLFHKIVLHDDNDAGGKQKAVETVGFTREFLSILHMLNITKQQRMR